MTIAIGTTRRGKRLVLSDTERARHIHVLGAIGTGKSKLLEAMIRADISRGRGLCLIDPHGTLVDSIEAWCAARGLGRIRRIHLIRPGDDAFVPGFNPLRIIPGEALSVRVDAMVAACAQAWGVRDMGETPRLEKILRATFYTLSVRSLTLAEGPDLLRASDPEGLRRRLSIDLPDPVFQITWEELNEMPRREFAEYVESTITRLSRFLAAPAMRLVVGQSGHAIDFRAAMDNGEIVLVNLGARSAFSYENARVLGTLLINDLFLTALGRDERVARLRPFTLYIDEAYDFLSGDIERILDQTRKFGLHAVLAHQRIGQLKERGDGIYNAVMGGTQTKIILGGLSDDDAAIMAREIMRGDIDLERPKITMPIVVDEIPFWLESDSSSEGWGTNRSTTYSITATDGITTSIGTGTTYTAGENDVPEQRGLSESASEATSHITAESFAVSDGYSRSGSRTTGRSQTLKPVREERAVQFYSLDESLHLAQLKLRNLPDRAAIVKRRGKRTVCIETAEVSGVLKLPRAVARFRALVAERSPYLLPRDAAELAIQERRRRLSQLAKEPPPPSPTPPLKDEGWG
jgi:Type IV secretion-system coupling protein DNA-binding domain